MWLPPKSLFLGKRSTVYPSETALVNTDLGESRNGGERDQDRCGPKPALCGEIGFTGMATPVSI